MNDPLVREAVIGDAATMAAIFREGIEDRLATFETRPASEAEMATLYVARDAHGSGLGRALMVGLAEVAERAGYHKLVGKIFTANSASIALVRSCGWSEVGVHRRHGRLDGEWRDVLVVEKLLGDAGA